MIKKLCINCDDCEIINSLSGYCKNENVRKDFDRKENERFIVHYNNFGCIYWNKENKK